jgi:trypsin-like peptidase
MFADACSLALRFIRPIVISQQLFNGDLISSVGTCVVVNSEGWILTAHHIPLALANMEKERAEIAEWERKKAAIEADKTISAGNRKRKIKDLGTVNPKATRNYSAWWGFQGANLSVLHAAPAADLAVAKLTVFDPNTIGSYPRIKGPIATVPIGTSLCRLGYPFTPEHAKPTYDAAANTFTLASDVLPPVFPIEGILTRMVSSGVATRGYPLAFIETSSPGLIGQSGGPIVDTRGTLWAIQSRTASLSLGFTPTVIKDGKPASPKEHQFLNLGWGVHPETITGLLDEFSIRYESAGY